MVVEYGGHRFEVKADRLWGGQMIVYNGKKVARSRSVGDATIDFVVVEDDEKIVYEVMTVASWFKYPEIREVRRNGETVYELRHFVEYNGHRIEAGADRPMGGQMVSYDGEEVARKVAIGDTTIDFAVVEDDEKIVYEVITDAGWSKYPEIREVRRNGEPVYELWRDRLDRGD